MNAKELTGYFPPDGHEGIERGLGNHRSIHYIGERFLGVFEPHSVDSLGVQSLDSAAVILGYCLHAVDRQYTSATLWSEQASSIKQSDRKKLYEALQSAGEGSDFERMIKVLKGSNLEMADGNHLYVSILMNVVQILRDVRPDLELDLRLERSMLKPRRTRDWVKLHDAMGRVSATRYLKSSRKMLEEVILRDVRLAAQLAERVDHPGTVHVLQRGTMHVGMMQVLERFSPDLLKGVDMGRARLVQVERVKTPFYGLLSARGFWEELLAISGMHVGQALRSGIFAMRRPIQSLLSPSARWGERLQADILEQMRTANPLEKVTYRFEPLGDNVILNDLLS